jgi:hypothetical protein
MRTEKLGGGVYYMTAMIAPPAGSMASSHDAFSLTGRSITVSDGSMIGAADTADTAIMALWGK